MNKIKAIKAIEILDSRGNPTIEVEVFLTEVSGVAKVPSGASTGKKEALELRDNDLQRYFGKGVLKAISNITDQIQPALLNIPIEDQLAIDNLLIQLDGSCNKAKLGANAMLAVSLAVARAGANYHKLELYKYLENIYTYGKYHTVHIDNAQLTQSKSFFIPTPLINIINGGVHADNNLSVQEFMIVPVGAPNFTEALRFSVEIFYALKVILKQHKLATSVGDEGGFAPNLSCHEQALDYILLAIEQAGLVANQDVALALDVAANEFFAQGYYIIENNRLTTEQFIKKLISWTNNYPIISIEDGLAEDDLIGWQELTKQLGHKIQLIGDDLFVTNPKIFEHIVQSNTKLNHKVANAILIKPNQIGTLSETFTTIKLARQNDYNYIISHRSGETEDSFIADLAVGTYATQIKTGSVCRSERISKYNRLLKIEKMIL